MISVWSSWDKQKYSEYFKLMNKVLTSFYKTLALWMSMWWDPLGLDLFSSGWCFVVAVSEGPSQDSLVLSQHHTAEPQPYPTLTELSLHVIIGSLGTYFLQQACWHSLFISCWADLFSSLLTTVTDVFVC